MDRARNQIDVTLDVATPSGVHSERGVSASQAPARPLSDAGAVAGPASSGLAVGSPVHFTMPTPPSTNHLFKNVRGVGRVKASHYDDFLRMGVAAIRGQRVGKVSGHVVAVIGVERMSDRADIDNRLKALLDTIVSADVIEDDNRITALAIAWLPKANGLAHVSIYPVGQLFLTFHPSQNGASGGWFHSAPFPEGEENVDFS